MSTEYSPCTDEEYSEEKENKRIPITMSDSDTEDGITTNEKLIIKNEEKVEVLNKLPKRSVPNCNVPEKIIFCVDACQTTDTSLFFLDHGTTFTPHNMLKRITDCFLYSKQAINSKTEFALIILKDSEPVWLHNFTQDILNIALALDSFDPEECTVDEFDLSKVFDLISDKVSMPELTPDYKLVPPPNTVRLILMYSRSDCTLKSPVTTAAYQFLKDHPYFTVDIIYTHEKNCAAHKCEEIYDLLQSLDNGYSYMFEVTRSAQILHECAAKLLAHPLQRPLQKHASYSFEK